MTAILSDAEYRRLTDNEKAKYWAHRFQDMEVERDKLRMENYRLRGIVAEVKDAVSTA